MSTILYVAGPMTGLPEFNYPAFNAAASQLRELGYEVLNPADIDVLYNPDPTQPQEWDWYMRHALRMVLNSDALALLPGWENSRGAQLEVKVGKALGMECLPIELWVERAA